MTMIIISKVHFGETHRIMYGLEDRILILVALHFDVLVFIGMDLLALGVVPFSFVLYIFHILLDQIYINVDPINVKINLSK